MITGFVINLITVITVCLLVGNLKSVNQWNDGVGCTRVALLAVLLG